MKSKGEANRYEPACCQFGEVNPLHTSDIRICHNHLVQLDELRRYVRMYQHCYIVRTHNASAGTAVSD